MRRVARFALPLFLVLFAASALAVTEAELMATATQLDAEYTDLEDRFEADTEPHPVLYADYQALEEERDQLHQDRLLIPPGCGCSALDATIAHIDATSEAIARTISSWEESG